MLVTSQKRKSVLNMGTVSFPMSIKRVESRELGQMKGGREDRMEDGGEVSSLSLMGTYVLEVLYSRGQITGSPSSDFIHSLPQYVWVLTYSTPCIIPMYEYCMHLMALASLLPT